MSITKTVVYLVLEIRNSHITRITYKNVDCRQENSQKSRNLSLLNQRFRVSF